MSNYTIAVAWSGKDALSDSDVNKVISGSDFNTEFTAVQTVVNSKADLNGLASESFASDNLTAAGTLIVTGATTLAAATATTPSPVTDDSTKVATTAFVQDVVDADVTTHAGLRPSSTVFGHAKIYVTAGVLYIETS
jgi:hypothetical protein